MKLTESFPCEVVVDGAAYAIRTDYRCGIRHEQMMLYRNDLTVKDILENWLPVIPENLAAALEAVNRFYRCGENLDQEIGRKRRNTRLYDFDVDADVIASSFRQCYGICLHTAQLHWWEFCELLDGLPAKCSFSDRVQLRDTDTKGMKSKDRRKVEEQKRRWRLPDTIHSKRKKYQTLEERNAAMIAYVDKRFAEIER
ncbi:MAG: Gp15 family bacteriophage protein [Eubacteriales bacterium]|nr:Gp15 family bacteriophage protein [Eubacteriales bacterium]